MDIGRATGLGLAVASTLVGLYGLLNTKPLPLSARLGALAPLDRTQDGRISPDEWARAGRPVQEMTALDTNQDGFIEPDETRRRRSGGGH